MATHGMLALVLAVQNTISVSMIIVSTDFRPESSLFGRSNSPVSATFSQSIWNITVSNLIQTEIEVPQASPPKVNKVIWVILAMPLGCWGFDRCFMGQICCGVVKGSTLGGFAVWYLIDFWVCFISCASKRKEIRTVGYDAVFEESTIDGAFIVAIIFLILPAVSSLANLFIMKKQYNLQTQVQARLADRKLDEGLAIPSSHQSLAYIPTALAKGLRKAGFVQETPTIPELIAAFDRIDKNGDGMLDHGEIKEALGAMGASDETVGEMIKDVDTDGDGKISKTEFLTSMTLKGNT